MARYTEPEFEIIRRAEVRRPDGMTGVLQRRHARLADEQTADYLALTFRGETAYYRFEGRPSTAINEAWDSLKSGQKVDWKTLDVSELIWRDTRYKPEGGVVAA